MGWAGWLGGVQRDEEGIGGLCKLNVPRSFHASHVC